MLPAAAAMAVCPLLAAWLAGRHGLWVPLTLGGLALTLSMVAMSRLTAFSGSVLPHRGLHGVRHSAWAWSTARSARAAVSAMPPSQAGLASGIASASRQLGQALGVAVTGALLNANLHGPVPTHFATRQPPGLARC